MQNRVESSQFVPPFILAIAIACNVAPMANVIPPFVFMRGRISTKSRTAVEGRDRMSWLNSQVIETFWRGGKLPVNVRAKGECTRVTLILYRSAIIAFTVFFYLQRGSQRIRNFVRSMSNLNLLSYNYYFKMNISKKCCT